VPPVAPSASSRCSTPPSSVAAPDAPVTEVPEHGTVEFRDVGFRYPVRRAPVLSGVSFRRAGQTTAIIGSTGAGKTTLST
jgi:ATP-binding cassette, subfamily B, multidrug efflux pump